MRGGALAAVVARIPAAALACSIARRTVDAVVPSDGATGVPLNAEIKYLASQPTTWSLTDDTGTVVPAVDVRSGGPHVAFRPAQALLPNRTYTVTITGGSDSATSTFTTGSSVDTESPTSPGRPGVDRVEGPIINASSCSHLGYYLFLWAGVSDVETPATELVATCSRIDADRGCLMSWAPASSAPVFLKARTVDWAGNFSDFTQPEPVEPGNQPEVGRR